MWDRSTASKNEPGAMLMLKVGVLFGNGKRLRAPSPSLRFHARVGLAELELQTRAVEKAFSTRVKRGWWGAQPGLRWRRGPKA